jgi:multidrug resistance efflux pump
MVNAGPRPWVPEPAAQLKVKDGQDVKQGQLLVEWHPCSFTILTEEGGPTFV